MPKPSGPEVLDDLVPVRTFRTVDRPMSWEAGLGVLTSRCGTSIGVLRHELAVRGLTEAQCKRNQNRNACRFRLEDYVAFDVVFQDLLHASFEEMAFLGRGRKYLISGVLRAVLAGLCDRKDPSGRSGDFGVPSVREQRVRLFCRTFMWHLPRYGKHTLQVYLTRASTPCLRALYDCRSGIRRLVAKSSKSELSEGVRAFVLLLRKFRKALKWRRTKIRRERREAALRSGKTDEPALGRFVRKLVRLQDTSLVYWERSPSDADWLESGRRGTASRRKVCRRPPGWTYPGPVLRTRSASRASVPDGVPESASAIRSDISPQTPPNDDLEARGSVPP